MSQETDKKDFDKLKMEKARLCIERLVKDYPKLFSLMNPKPLKVGITKDIESSIGKPEAKKIFLKTGLKKYTQTKGYLRSMLKEKSRYGLDGKVAGDVTEEHRKHAEEELVRKYGEKPKS